MLLPHYTEIPGEFVYSTSGPDVDYFSASPLF